MQDDRRVTRTSLWLKLIFSQAMLTLAAVLLAEGMAWGVLLLFPVEFTRGAHAALVTVAATLSGLLLGLWASRPILGRIRRALEISHAWLRGNLAVRVNDSVSDDLGLLAEQLNQLAEHLEQDEQDLFELRDRNARLTDQVRTLTVVEERNRLARELHDSVKQYLFSLAMTASGLRTRFDSLQNASGDEIGAMVADVAPTVREVEMAAQAAQRELTRLIKDLRPGSLEERGLVAALNDYTLLFGAREHLLIYLDVQGNDALLSPSVAEGLYRVAQEALHNVARHARATRVDVRLRCLPEQAMLTVRDNGVGFDIHQMYKGLGMANMQERMMSVGGLLTVESQPGGGTTVRAEVGLAQAAGLSADVVRRDQERPDPTIENWAWLGQKLVIPVGQTWPWLPADLIHLRNPLVEVESNPLILGREGNLLVLGRGYVLRQGQQRVALVRIRRIKFWFRWKLEGASWTMYSLRDPSDKMVLTRNQQPLAAMQYQGRLVNTWVEIIYDGRGYRLSCAKTDQSSCVLTDEAGEEILLIKQGIGLEMELRRALPLPLIVMVAVHSMDETGLMPISI